MKILSLASFILLAVGGHSLEVVPIKDWSGEDSRRTEVLPNPVPWVVILHTVTPECQTDTHCEELVRSMRQYFIRIGGTDMAYSFLIGSNGKVYEGAGWNLIGAHTRGYNNKSIGIAFIGDFREKQPTAAALQAAKDLLDFGLTNKHLAEDYKLVGHRQLSNTISPGEALQNIIQTWPHWENVH